MQSLDIVTVNIWQILISLCNLLIIFLIIRKFLYKPVMKMLGERQAAVDEQYAAAEQDKAAAAADKAAWEDTLKGARAEADTIVQNATAAADRRGAQIVAQAEEKAERILRQARAEVELEKQKAENEVKQEIVDVSALLAEKMLQREIKADDHRTLIRAFIDDVDGEQ